jgi:outer membrane protein assembly factor BamD (BamD/ComL family)
MKKLLLSVLLPFIFLTLQGFPRSGNDQRLYESGIAFLSNNNFEQAFMELSNLINQYKNSPYADDALLVIGKYFYKNKNNEKAVEYFSNIVNNYRTTDSCDDAFYFLGLINLQKGDIENAYNNFTAVKTGFPNSNVLDLVFYNLAVVSIHKNQYKKALYFLANIYTRFSESSIFDNAMKKAAYCFYKIDKPGEGLKMLAALNENNLNDKTSNSLTASLLRFMTHKKYKKAKVYYEHPYANLLCNSQSGDLYTATKKDPHILTISEKRSKRKNTPTPVQAMTYSDNYGLCYSIGDRIYCEKSPHSKSFNYNGEILKEIVSFFIDPYNNFWVFDKDTGFLYKYSSKGKPIKQFTYPKVDYVKFRQDGKMFVVHDSRKIVDIKTLEGKTIKQLTNYGKIKDIAFDSIGNIFLLADKGKTIVVLNDKFNTFQRFSVGLLGVGVDKVDHLSVGFDSQIYLSSSKNGKIYRVF